MWNLGEPGSRFRAAAPNHPEALLEEPQAFKLLGEKKRKFTQKGPSLASFLRNTSIMGMSGKLLPGLLEMYNQTFNTNLTSQQSSNWWPP